MSAVTHPRDHVRAVAQLILAALCWSLGGLLIKAVAWSPMAVSAGRGLLAAIFLLLTNRKLRFTFSKLQILGALSYASCTLSFCVANKMTSAANTILLQYSAPVWIALFGAWFLGEKATWRDWVTIVVVLGGMCLFFVGDLDTTHVAGNLVAVLSGVCFAAMTLAMRKQKDGSAVESIILGNLIGFLAGLPWIVTAGPLSSAGWGALLVLGVVQLGVSYWLYARAIRHVTALEAVLVPVIEPILNPVWVLIAFGEKPSGYALIGGAIVLVAVSLRTFDSIRARTGWPSAEEAHWQG